jgi:hypothetical protein
MARYRRSSELSRLADRGPEAAVEMARKKSLGKTNGAKAIASIFSKGGCREQQIPERAERPKKKPQGKSRTGGKVLGMNATQALGSLMHRRSPNILTSLKRDNGGQNSADSNQVEFSFSPALRAPKFRQTEFPWRYRTNLRKPAFV